MPRRRAAVARLQPLGCSLNTRPSTARTPQTWPGLRMGGLARAAGHPTTAAVTTEFTPHLLAQGDEGARGPVQGPVRCMHRVPAGAQSRRCKAGATAVHAAAAAALSPAAAPLPAAEASPQCGSMKLSRAEGARALAAAEVGAAPASPHLAHIRRRPWPRRARPAAVAGALVGTTVAVSRADGPNCHRRRRRRRRWSVAWGGATDGTHEGRLTLVQATWGAGAAGTGALEKAA